MGSEAVGAGEPSAAWAQAFSRATKDQYHPNTHPKTYPEPGSGLLASSLIPLTTRPRAGRRPDETHPDSHRLLARFSHLICDALPPRRHSTRRLRLHPTRVTTTWVT